jgi:hypothetical protein
MPPKDRRPPPNHTTVWEIDGAGEDGPDHPDRLGHPDQPTTRPLEPLAPRLRGAARAPSGDRADGESGRACCAWGRGGGDEVVFGGVRVSGGDSGLARVRALAGRGGRD